MKILIGTVPYGRDNVGDEAILATVVQSVRKAFPDAEITASTDEPETTTKKMNIRTVPLLGFIDPPYDQNQLISEMKRADLYIWGGATGLSDYPDTALHVADIALENNTKLVLYSCGMNNKLNPAHFKLHPGKKMLIFKTMQLFTFNKIDFVKKYEKNKVMRTKLHIKNTLEKADLVICRDEQSKKQLELCGLKRKIYATNDPAVLLQQSDDERLAEIWKKHNLWEDEKPIIGVCISAQRAVKNSDGIVAAIDEMIEKYNAHVLFIPMNHKTDSRLMQDLHVKLKNSNQAKVLTGFYEPEEITAIASKMALVISSRLHLLILCAINCVPIVGLSRGSKIDNFLSLYNEKSCGSVEEIDAVKLKKTCARILNDPEKFRKKAKPILADLIRKANINIELLKDI